MVGIWAKAGVSRLAPAVRAKRVFFISRSRCCFFQCTVSGGVSNLGWPGSGLHDVIVAPAVVGNTFVNPLRQWDLPGFGPFLAVFIGGVVQDGVFGPPLIQDLRSSLPFPFRAGFLEFALLALLQSVGDPSGRNGADRRSHGSPVIFVDGLAGESAASATEGARHSGSAVESRGLAGVCRLRVITAGGP